MTLFITALSAMLTTCTLHAQGLWQGLPSPPASVGMDATVKEPWLFLDTGGLGVKGGWGAGHYRLADISFLNARTGVVIGGSGAFRTDDGGLTWRKLPLGPVTSADGKAQGTWWYSVIRMVSEQEIWVLGHIYPGGFDRTRLTRSMDGGLTWNDLLPGKLDSAGRLHFPNATERWAIGRTTAFRSADAGATWSQVNWKTPFAVGDVQVVADAPDAIATYAVGGTPGGKSTGIILKSEGGGATWRSLPLPAETPALTRLCFLNTQEGWVAGLQGSVLHTSDGGATWEPRPLPFAQNVNALVFQQGGRGWAAVAITFNQGKYAFDWSLFSTRDGGRTWQPQLSRPKGINALATFGPGKVWAVGGIATSVPNDLVAILDEAAPQ